MPRVKGKWYLSNSSPPATLALGTAPVVSCARRVGRHPPRPSLAKRAYRAGRGPFPSPLTGRFSTGAQACSYLLQKSPGAADPACSCCAPCGWCGDVCVGVGSGGDRGAHALLTVLDPHPAPTPPTVQYPSPVPAILYN